VPSYQVDPSSPSPDGRAAPVRLGRYELVGHLATGGMAEIHLARLAGEAGFEKIVVVKRLLPELVASPQYVAMFLDEGKLVARLDHPNVCEVFELGRDGAEYYIAMPYLDGVAAHELIARPRDPDRIAQIRVAAGVVVQACAGLHHAHELRDADGAPANLVHRDVSPSNLFVTSAGTVKVLDFGVAKARGTTQTEANTIKGKAQYMAPEQLLGDALDRRCDVFALGIVAFELATHQRLFKRPSDYLAARAILEEPIPRADAVDPAVPASLADAIAKALSRDKAARFPDAQALGDAIAAAMAAHGGVAEPAAIGAAVTTSDELSAMRTRQARVLGEAKSRTSTSAVAGNVTITRADAVTRPLRPKPADDARTEVVGPRTFTYSIDANRKRTRLAIALGLGLAVLAVIIIVLWMSASTEDDRPPTVATPAPAPPASSGALKAEPREQLPLPPTAPVAPPTTQIPPTTQVPPKTQQPPRGSKQPPRTAPKQPKPTGIEPLPLPGTFSIDSTPYAKITLDGRRVGVTPLLKLTVAPGRHTIRATLEDGRTKDLVIEVPSGGAAPPVVLGW
jgi:eukaryotic-like serine/threonine-protein kinase